MNSVLYVTQISIRSKWYFGSENHVEIAYFLFIASDRENFSLRIPNFNVDMRENHGDHRLVNNSQKYLAVVVNI